jgi:hypothetical protein
LELSSGVDAHRSLSRGVLMIFSDIVNKTGESVGFEGGTTYLVALGNLVPRLLWPEKPDSTVGKVIGQKYGFVQAEDDATSIASTVMGEGYMNFGLAGLLTVMAAYGCLAAFVDTVLRAKLGMWFIAWSIPVALFGQEAAIAGATMQFVTTTALLFVCLTFFAKMVGSGRVTRS